MVVDVEEKVAAKEKEYKKEKEKEMLLKEGGLNSHNSNTVTQSANCCTE